MRIESVVSQNITIKEALSKIDSLAGNTLFIVNKDNRVLGSITDGDIRRGLLNDICLSDKVEKIMTRNFKFIQEDEFNPDVFQELKKLKIRFVPMLSKAGEILKIIDFKRTKSILPLEAVIMAGGRGSRLAPLTDDIPKPLLEIGGKPIIEYNIDRLISYGISKIYISVNYLKEQIMAYFGDGSKKGIHIEYIEEDDFTGTLGSATYINQYGTREILVMNSDLLTNIDFEDFYKLFYQSNAEMAVASVSYEVNIPYGVLNTNKEHDAFRIEFNL